MTRRLLGVMLLAALPLSAGTNIPAWVREAAATKAPPASESTSAVVLLQSMTVEVVSPIETYTRWRRVAKIVNAAGRDDYGSISAYYDKESKVKTLKAWAIDRNGLEYETRDKEIVETSPYNGELFNDSRIKMVRVPGVDIGSIVAYEIEVRDRPNHLQATWRFQGGDPVALARLEVKVPPQLMLKTNWTNHDPVEPVSPGVWELHDVPAITDEPRRPSMDAIAGRMSINLDPALKSWADLARWYANLAFPRNELTQDMFVKVRELAPKGASLDGIRAIAHFAQRDIRYVAVEIGIGGYQPHAAGDIFKTRNGDCKDKATLLRTMLKSIGVDSHYVLVNTTRGVIDPAFPTPSVFDHVILAIHVPAEAKGPAIVQHPEAGRLMLFDPTNTTTPFGYLPEYLQASHGLLVTNNGGDLIALPAHDADANQLRRTAKLKIDESGTLSGHVDEIRTGGMASDMRRELLSRGEADRTRYLESMMSFHFTHSSIGTVTIEHLDDVDADLVVRYEITAPGYMKRAADMLLVRPRVIGQKSETIIDMAERKNGYVTDGPSVQTDEIEIQLPAALKLDELPAPVTVKTPALEYSSKSEFEPGVLRYKRRYALRTFYVEKEKIPELNKAFSQILADERASAVLR